MKVRSWAALSGIFALVAAIAALRFFATEDLCVFGNCHEAGVSSASSRGVGWGILALAAAAAAIIALTTALLAAGRSSNHE